MIKLAIKHKILELCINNFFSTVRKNFPLGNSITIQVSTIGDHNISEYIGLDIIGLKLDPDVSHYTTTSKYNTLCDDIDKLRYEFPLQIKQGIEPHTAILYRDGVRCGVMDFKSNIAQRETHRINVNEYLYLTMVKSDI